MRGTRGILLRPTRTKAGVAVMSLVAGMLSGLAIAGPAAAAPTKDVRLAVVASRNVNTAVKGAVKKGDAVAKYRWLINREDVGNPHDSLTNCLPDSNGPQYSADPAATCAWPSIRITSGWAPILTQGDESDLNKSTALTGLPDGKYLISVLADGYKIGGVHFTIPMATSPVTVELQPDPLPLATLRIQVFEDSVPTDGTYEADVERGLSGFVGHINDVMGEVTTDYYGNALCTKYQHERDSRGRLTTRILFSDGAPVIDPTSTGKCVSDATGEITIPNLGPNRYSITVSPPVGQADWVQTTTLEGAHDYDWWLMEGYTGYDVEATIGGEMVPAVPFGFVRAKSAQPRTLPRGTPTPTGSITGVGVVGNSYIGGLGGQIVPETGTVGASIQGPIDRPWIAVSDLDNNDQLAAMVRGGTDGRFTVPKLPDGNYQVTVWDDPQDLILWSFNATVRGGKQTDLGTLMLVGWFTKIKGKVCYDNNGNGTCDPGEAGVPGVTLTFRERDNSFMDQYTNTVTTDAKGNYVIVEGYPLSKWLVLEAFDTRYESTGVTVRADNDPTPLTFTGNAVDISVLPVLGLGGTIDWAVQRYKPKTNGGIVGTISYDTTRNELNPADSVTEPYQPGIPGIPVKLYAVERDVNGDILLGPDGQPVKGPLLNTTVSEEFEPPRGCTARMWDGTPLNPSRQLALPQFGPDADKTCVEAPMMGWQARPSGTEPGAFEQTVNGNYGFSSSLLNLYEPGDPNNPAPSHDLPLYADLAAAGYDEQPLLPQEYIVEVDIPRDYRNKPMYEVTKEEDVNVFNGSAFLPQENFPPTASDLANIAAGATEPVDPPTEPPSQTPGIVSGCVGPMHTVHVTDGGFLDAGGSPFEGQDRPLCTAKLVNLRSQQAVAPDFHLFTPVPLPTHFWGLVINDLGLTFDPRSASFGEAQPIPNIPVGLYDWSGTLIDTVDTDYNGFYEALEPSTNTYNCPLPAGPCPGMYLFVGNDPGQPGRVNPNYNPRFRTISTPFQAWPGLFTVTDTAPTQVGVIALSPDGTDASPVNCDVLPGQPELFAVSQPYRPSGSNQQVTITGRGFGASRGTNGKVTLDGSTTGITYNSWNDTQIKVTVASSVGAGAKQLAVTSSTGRSTVNGITFHVLGGSGSNAYNPTLFQVGPGKTYKTVQAGLDAAARNTRTNSLVIVWPGTPGTNNPRGAYFENIIVHSSVKLQGVGPGGVYADGTFVPGSEMNGLAFDPDGDTGTNWYNLLGSLTWSGLQDIADGAVITVLASSGASSSAYKPAIDGFTITGGYQNDFPVNLNAVTGGVHTPYGGVDGARITQGGGIYVNAYARYLQITNNIIVGNGGSYAGGIRVGTPYAGDQHNYDMRIAYNRIRDNGGTNLAGGVALFNGSNDYEVDHNDICGNFSQEYGGGVSHYGRSDGGRIHDNRVYFNASYDEGGGVMIAGELSSNPAVLTAGSGPVTIDSNLVALNLANDDGGGIRLLQPANFRITIQNNMIVDNISTHEGGGVALDDAPDVAFLNNTVAKNLTTATAMTSDGTAAPAGLSTTENSAILQAKLPAGSPTFSRPALLNNVFTDNRAGSWDGFAVTGLGADGDTSPVNVWDVGAWDGSGPLQPRYSVLSSTRGTDATPVNPGTNKISSDPHFVAPYDVGVSVTYWRNSPAFRQALVVARNLPPELLGDYHLADNTSPAYGLGVKSLSIGGKSYTAPTKDFDGDNRTKSRPDSGADERTTTGPTALRAGQAVPQGPQSSLLQLQAVLDDALSGRASAPPRTLAILLQLLKGASR